MDESKQILAMGIFAIILIVGLVSYLSGTVQGNATYPLYKSISCDEGMVPVHSQETRFGTGKTVVVDCVNPGTPITAHGDMFPVERQRWLVMPR